MASVDVSRHLPIVLNAHTVAASDDPCQDLCGIRHRPQPSVCAHVLSGGAVSVFFGDGTTAVICLPCAGAYPNMPPIGES
jgi:hypothetical protein